MAKSRKAKFLHLMRSIQLLMPISGLTLIALLMAACGNVSGIRPPTDQERKAVSAVVRWEYRDEAYVRSDLRPHDLRPQIVRIRISRSDPRFGAALVNLRGSRSPGRRPSASAVLVLRRVNSHKAKGPFVPWDPPWEPIGEARTIF